VVAQGFELTDPAPFAEFQRLLPKLTTGNQRGHPPLVSICIPSYNCGAFIESTLNSVLQQTYRPLEVIITDDCSTDGTVGIIKGFSDPRIRLIQNDANLGVGFNWNKALSFATGTYIKLMGGDDLVYPECIHRQVQALEDPASSNVVLAVCNADVVNARGQTVLRRRSSFQTGQISGRRLIRNSVRWGTNRIGEPVAGLFRRAILEKSGMFDPANPYMIDLAFWAELLKHGDAFLDETRLVAFRISVGSVSAKVGLKQAASFRRFIRQLRADPVYRTAAADAWMGNLLSFQWCMLRNFVVALQRDKARKDAQ